MRPDHLDNTVLGFCTELPFGLMLRSLSYFPPLSASHMSCQFVVWACFALKSVTSVGIRKLDWTECSRQLVWLFTFMPLFWTCCRNHGHFSVSLWFNFSQSYKSLGCSSGRKQGPVMWLDTDDKDLVCHLYLSLRNIIRKYTEKRVVQQFCKYIKMSTNLPTCP